MYTDARGGSNKKAVNTNFFKFWSPNMAYVLGLIFSDGAIEDVRKSSRTCYLQITSVDKSLIEQVKRVMSSSHNIYLKKPRTMKIKGKIYTTSLAYSLRIGSKEIFQDLVNRSITPRKSLRLKFPSVPKRYFKFFLRGYLDGDGCISIYKHKDIRRKIPMIQVIFTSGTPSFLKCLSEKLVLILRVTNKNINLGSKGAYDLRYKSREAIRVLDYIYSTIKFAPYLDRKYLKYIEAKEIYTQLDRLKSPPSKALFSTLQT